MSAMLRLNIGCGTVVPQSWTNVDYAFGAWVAKLPLVRRINARLKVFHHDWNERILLHDIRKPLPWADGTVDAVYSSHTLEHLSKEDGRRFLKECHRVLKVGAAVRLVVPDLATIVRDYADGALKADDFVEALGVLYDKKPGLLGGAMAKLLQFPHQCMYDRDALLRVLRDIGFEARSMEPFESSITNIVDVELLDRTSRAVIVEGVKR